MKNKSNRKVVFVGCIDIQNHLVLSFGRKEVKEWMRVKKLLIELVCKGINKEYRCYNSGADLGIKLKVLAIRTRKGTN